MRKTKTVTLFGLSLLGMSVLGCASADAPVPATHAAPLTASYSWDGDLPRLRDATEADCHFESEKLVLRGATLYRVYKVRYRSLESRGGTLSQIEIRGYAARPDGGSKSPAVVLAHGLGGSADESATIGLAERLSAFVLSYTGPGGGTSPDNTSEGAPAFDGSGYRMFDTLGDVRGSWFWGHTAAALRGITCLAARPEVDVRKLGLTGYSAGGVATLIGTGADDRIAAGVALSGTLAWDVATDSADAWQHALLQKAGLSTASREWQKLTTELIDPARALGKTAGKLLLIDGTTDEFFPLTALVSTVSALPPITKSEQARISLAANFDHGCYKLSGVESASAIEARALLRSDGGQRMWFGNAFGTDSRFRSLPATPQVSTIPVGAGTLVTAVVDEPSSLAVDEVRLFVSADRSYTYANVKLDRDGSRTYRKLLPLSLAGSVTFVDVQYKTRDLLSPVRFSLSSLPSLPSGMVPHIRSQTSCL
ncbi:MAG TPA: prolyl oligopeptidase family serine peptidase [Pseudomonadota bacterium]|nr:prolyl oligopeptidase family serine peptidase [Pseudomonadota bacterium]HNK46191.1 prolyl oligopeptidase family serine peptidase [Pseudomonadota bacterium]HNN53168.1 prolyl oligopeptidase family serine peptidase [Pseudomonadota bacterium]